MATRFVNGQCYIYRNIEDSVYSNKFVIRLLSGNLSGDTQWPVFDCEVVKGRNAFPHGKFLMNFCLAAEYWFPYTGGFKAWAKEHP